jgi:hypothetical protein
MPRLLRLDEVRASAEGKQPPGYRLARRFRLHVGLLNVIAVLLLLPVGAAFALLTAPLGGPLDLRAGRFDLRFGGLEALLVILTVALIMPTLHELLHGAVAALFGGRPVYGIGPGVAFCHVPELLSKGQYAAVAAAPLVALTAAGLLAMPLLPPALRAADLAMLVTNAVGAVGDVAALVAVARLPRRALIADTADGFEAFAPVDLPRSPMVAESGAIESHLAAGDERQPVAGRRDGE